MLKVSVSENGAEPTIYKFDKSEITLGRVKGNDIVLPKTTVSKRHSRVVLKDGKMYFIDLKSMNGTFINGTKITTATLITENDRVTIGDFFLYFSEVADEVVDNDDVLDSQARVLNTPQSKRIPTVSVSNTAAVSPVSSQMTPPSSPQPIFPQVTPATPVPPGPGIALTPMGVVPPSGSVPMGPGAIMPSSPAVMPERVRLAPNATARPGDLSPTSPGAQQLFPEDVEYELYPATMPRETQLKIETDVRLSASFDAACSIMDAYLPRHDLQTILERVYPPQCEDRALSEELASILSELSSQLSPGVDNALAIQICIDEIVGLGILDKILDDPDIERVTISAANTVVIEEHDNRTLSLLKFSSADTLYAAVYRLLSLQGLTPQNAPSFNNILMADGTVVNIVLPPVCATPFVTVNKIRQENPSLSQLVKAGALSRDMESFLNLALRAKRNILIVGPEFPGRHVFLNALVALLPDGERIACYENYPTLHLHQTTAVRFEAQNPIYYPAADMAQLMMQNIKLQNERIVVNAVHNPAELNALISLLNSGVQGALAVFGATRNIDAVNRINEMLQPQRMHIGSYFDLAITLRAHSNAGGVKVQEISELSHTQKGVRTIFRYTETGMGVEGRGKGSFVACGVIPKFCRELELGATAVDYSMFNG